MPAFKFYKQLNVMDCGPTCLRMIANFYGRHYNVDTLRAITGFNKAGVNLLGISDAAEKIGFRSRGVKISIQQLSSIKSPCILHWNQNHFVVFLSFNRRFIKIADPAKGIIRYRISDFKNRWVSSINSDGAEVGLALLLDPTPAFYSNAGENQNKLSWLSLLGYLRNRKLTLLQVFLTLILASILQIFIPFLTQSVVDAGITTKNLSFVVVLLLAQAFLTFSITVIGFIRSRLLLFISNLLNLQILSDFWIKLMKLPVSYFELHQTGDTLQRINDHAKIQHFLTGPALNTIFSSISFIIYSSILVIYSIKVFLIFLLGSILYFTWVHLFLNFKRKINYQTFDLSAAESTTSLQLIQGMQEIRLYNAEKLKRWQWENIQASIFKLNEKNLKFTQWQSSGATLINQFQNITITFFVAQGVINESLTLGSMLAIQFIIGQLSGPIEQWVGFVQSAQDAKISLERLNEIHSLKNEEDDKENSTSLIPTNNSIHIKNLSFAYPGSGNEKVLKNIQLTIPSGKVTAIVGSSGSGKTTLLKLLLKIYSDYDGEIRIGSGNDDLGSIGESNGVRLDLISHMEWRRVCGTVFQDGFIFNDTIINNIAVGKEKIDVERVIESTRIANILGFIESLPNGFYTKLGSEGSGLSQGQKQRILIARAVYKDPLYFFFDEATNALDANNERKITDNLKVAFSGKTVIVVAHRLSTVKNADQIIVMHNGEIIESGTHDELSKRKAKYYELVSNQLELGS
jgi:ATP-binding cassette subfamily B protein